MSTVFRRYSLYVLYGAAVLLSVWISQQKVRSLEADMYPDYTYYMQFAATGLSSAAQSYVPLWGNSLIYNGADAYPEIHKGLHFEPFKYVTALVYRLVSFPEAVFLLYALLFFSPLLYAANLLRKSPERYGLWWGSLLYGVFPAALTLATADLRPFSLLIPFAWMFYLSVIYSRPAREQVLFLIALLLTREEGLVYGLAGVAYVWIYAWVANTEKRTPAKLSYTWILGFVVVATYMYWIGDGFEFRGFWSVTTLISKVGAGGVTALAGVILVLTYLVWHGRDHLRKWYIPPSVLSGALVLPLLAAFAMKIVVLEQSIPVILDGRFGMLLLIAVVISTCAFTRDRISSSSTALPLVVLAILASVSYQISLPSSAMNRAHAVTAKIDNAAVVWNARTLVPPGALLIVDERTAQAFYDRPRVVVLESQDLEKEMEQEGKKWVVVVERSSLPDSMNSRLQIVAQNGSFVIMRTEP